MLKWTSDVGDDSEGEDEDGKGEDGEDCDHQIVGGGDRESVEGT